MSKPLKILTFVLLSLIVVLLSITIYCFTITSRDNLDEKKLLNMDKVITYYDAFNVEISEQTDDTEVTEISLIPEYVKNAFISIEDKRFYKHNGVDLTGLLRAFVNNIKTMSFKEGGSTISQQLIKNTHLSNEKTFKRKLIEIKLAKQLEKKYSKEQILEKYLNTIYFGDNCYGITSASRHYFDKHPSELTINEGASLAATIKAPLTYSPSLESERNFVRKNLVLKQMYSQGYLSETELKDNLEKQITLRTPENENNFDFMSLVKKQLNSFFSDNAYLKGKISVYTTLLPNIQKDIENKIKENTEECDKSIVVLDKNSNIVAYSSTCKENLRQMGSTIKPLLVYAPAIDTCTVDSCSLIQDEKTDFNGYSPSNYNDKYYGKVSVKDSLAKSLNVCSVKILSSTGIENCIEYLKKTEIPITENDNNLSLALGATEKGATLTQICSAYNIFVNDGNYKKTNCISKISYQDTVIECNRSSKVKVFDEDTCYIINDMLKETVKNGTAKKLSYTNFPLCAKTGTVGNENGNTDAYSISYNFDYTIGVWFGNRDGKLMPNSISGGTVPTVLASYIWKNIYENQTPSSFPECDKVNKLQIDKISYEKDGIIELADDNAPLRYVKTELFKEKSVLKNKSTRFSAPNIDKPEISVNSNEIDIKLCLAEYYDALVYREENGKRKLVFDSRNSDKKQEFNDIDIEAEKEYSYYVIPYFYTGEKTILGGEVFIGKIKVPANNAGDSWWEDELD